MGKREHVWAVLFLPVLAAIVIPAALVLTTDSVDLGWSLNAPLALAPTFLGGLLICLGLVAVVKTIVLFDRLGKGTLAPWDPPQTLVDHGSYRRVRNPMIGGVYYVLLGEGMLLGSCALIAWFLAFVAGNLIYIPLLEERRLEKRFGAQYRRYAANVPRWIPRRTPWNAQAKIEIDG